MAAGNSASEIRLVRLYDAPLAVVWEAWTVPEEVEKWWGPRGFTLTTHSRDLRPGGHWHYTMHGPDGTDYENTARYLEVVPRRKLVYDHGGHRDRPPLFRVTVLFSEQDGRTQLEMTSALATPEAAEEMRRLIRKAGGEATWDRLAEHLGKALAGKEQFFISRSFDAPLERMYRLWTSPEELARWLPPTGATMRFIRTGVVAGDISFYEMTMPGGASMHGLLRFLALEPPRRIVYVQQFCDEQQRITRPPFFDHWPGAMLTTVELAAEGPQRTRVTVRWEPHGDTTAAEVAEFIRQRGGMTLGWTGSFDKLEALLAE